MKPDKFKIGDSARRLRIPPMNTREIEWLQAERAYVAYAATLCESTPWGMLVHSQRQAWLAAVRAVANSSCELPRQC